MVLDICKLVNKSIRLVRKQKEIKSALAESNTISNSKHVEISVDEYKKSDTILLDTTILEESSIQIKEAKVTHCTRLLKKGLVNPPKTTSTPQVMLPFSPIKPLVSQQNTPVVNENNQKESGTLVFPNKEFEDKLLQILKSKKLMYTSISKDQSVNNDCVQEVIRKRFKEIKETDSLNQSIAESTSVRKCKHRHNCKKTSHQSHQQHHHHHHHYHRHVHHCAASRYACCQKTLLNYAFCE